MIKAVLMTGSTAMVVGFSGTLLTLIWPKTLPALPAQYVKFAILLLLFVVILIGSSWCVMVPSGRSGKWEDPSGRDAWGGTR